MADKSTDNRKVEILAAAQALIFEQNTVKISLNEIASHLGITHVALYRHFKNKDDLWFSLAKYWLFGTEANLAEVTTASAVNPVEKLHIWLMTLTHTKQDTYQQHPAIFRLYTDMVQSHPELEVEHLENLRKQILTIFKIEEPSTRNLAVAQAILDAFSLFYDPRHKELWLDAKIKVRQENLWHLISPKIKIEFEQQGE
ncbi:TetR/AcrR family transcriptional regulator [Lactobacillus sp. UCMA15818]|uniref:TetR/AcrR family transcriptional regulator n=1 Tax=Lactobacillus sp. UCMA15818 TaxID=2583394 RepID=UPI0025B1352D|nr:TetR/AcrR family transcriptional regulator [Lactobacillus sp. UCMA15818]